MQRRSWIVAGMWGVPLIAMTVSMHLGGLNGVPPQSNGSPLDPRHWTHFVRIGGYSLSLDRVDAIIKDATDSHVFGIETDNDIPGRYETFLEPAEKLRAVKAVAREGDRLREQYKVLPYKECFDGLSQFKGFAPDQFARLGPEPASSRPYPESPNRLRLVERGSSCE